jgi:hypothetical protein
MTTGRTCESSLFDEIQDIEHLRERAVPGIIMQLCENFRGLDVDWVVHVKATVPDINVAGWRLFCLPVFLSPDCPQKQSLSFRSRRIPIETGPLHDKNPSNKKKGKITPQRRRSNPPARPKLPE